MADSPLLSPDLRKLGKLVQTQREDERRVREQVGRLRRSGVTWTAIAGQLGTSHQAAIKRFSR